MNPQKIQGKNTFRYLLALLILAELCVSTYLFSFHKEGVHSDEIWSYGLSNSYYHPYVFSEDNLMLADFSEEHVININHWIPGDTFLKYITVQPDERFAYGSVYYNQTFDSHPPLFYMLLHTVCSLFPDQFSFWFSYVLNMIFLTGTQIALFLLACRLSGSESFSFLACLFYGGTSGFFATFLFLRQYGLLTMLTLLFCYYCVSYYQSGFDWKYLLGACISSFAGFTTQYLYIFYAGIVTALLCLYMFAHTRLKQMFLFGGSILGSLLLFFLIYPASLKQFTHPSRETLVTLFSNPVQTRLLWNAITSYILGFRVNMFGSAFFRIILPFAGLGLLFAAMLMFVFRHEEWLHRLLMRIQLLPSKLMALLLHADYLPLILLLPVTVYLPFVGRLVDVFRMGDEARRYVSMLYPIVCLFVLLCAARLLTCISKLRRIRRPLLIILVLGIVLRTHILHPYKDYLVQNYGETQDTAELFAGKNILVVLNDQKNYWKLTCYSHYLYKSDNVFIVAKDALEQYMNDINSNGRTVDYVVIDFENLTLTPAETDFVLDLLSDNIIYEDREEDTTSIIISLEDDEDDKDEEDKIDPTTLIRQLNGGCDYDILYLLNIQGRLNYVLKLPARTEGI